MKARRLAFFVSVVPLVALMGSIPFLGVGIAIYLSLYIWAVLGFKYWLASIPFQTVVDLGSLTQSITVAVGGSQVIDTAINNSPPWAVQAWLVMEAVVVIAYPLMLWLAVRSIRAELIKRLGRSRFP